MNNVEYPYVNILASSKELSEILWALHLAAQEVTDSVLIARSAADDYGVQFLTDMLECITHAEHVAHELWDRMKVSAVEEDVFCGGEPDDN